MKYKGRVSRCICISLKINIKFDIIILFEVTERIGQCLLEPEIHRAQKILLLLLTQSLTVLKSFSKIPRTML
jgi:hypothetical protein